MINTLSNQFPFKGEPINNQYARIGDYELIKTLNYGVTSKVKLGRHVTTKKEYAIKIIKPEFEARYLSTVEQEARFMEAITKENHTNIIKLIECLPKTDYVKKNGKIKKVFAMVLELAEGGDLFECLKAIGELGEDIARTYFQQLLQTIEFLHEKGIVHRDIKPDNLLLSADLTLKLADFTFASYVLSENDNYIQRETFGTSNYLAPELIANNSLTTQCLDLFSCGVILFLMVVGQPPFEKATPQDPRYKYIIKHQFSYFWKQYERGGRSFSSEFKDLINAMLCFEPTERLTIAEIKAHPWYNGKTCSIEELREEYLKKEQEFIKFQEEKSKQMEKSKEEKALKKKMTEDQIKPKMNCFHMMKGITPIKYRSLSQIIDQEIKNRLSSEEIECSRESKDYIYTGYRGLTELFYDVPVDIMFKLILLLSKKLFNDCKHNHEEFKTKGRIISDTREFTGDISIELFKVDETMCCLNVTRIKGPLVPFYKYIEDTLKVEIGAALKHLFDQASD